MSSSFLNPYASRAESLRSKRPDLIGSLLLYVRDKGGRNFPAFPGWGCPCVVDRTEPVVGFDGWPLLDDPLEPGKVREGVGFVFLSKEGAVAMRSAERFYLWEGRYVGEVTVSK
ncbi:hypothetical protein [Qipengyuania sp. DGS5-3]|uniref:hypothetical protein n=1 Tax=Qipengyuania sp. DGS5-3 TaxID=3349632 RepID=UPI0036D3FF3B